VTSIRKINANRANARASTGPKTKQGRARSARNSLRHALSLPFASDPIWSDEISALAREIAGPVANAEIQELARRVAEAQIDLRRVRYARHHLLLNALSEPYYESRASRRKKMRILCQLLQPNAPDIPLAIVAAFLTSTPQGPHKLAVILSEEVSRLLVIDRYERRATSRRKFAIRALDKACMSG
jgi:hypothetical protein